MKDRYLRQDKDGSYYVDFKPDYPIIDCHIHMSNLLPGKQISINEELDSPRYLTLPPPSDLDLSIPYWTRKNFLIKKYKSAFSLLGYIGEAYRIFKDMLRGTYGNYKKSSSTNAIYKSLILPISTSRSDQSKNAISNSKTKEDLIAFMSVHPADKDAIEKVSYYKSLGAVGLKLKMTSSELNKNYSSLLKLMDHCHNLNLPVIFHSGSILDKDAHISSMSKKLLNTSPVEMFVRLLEDMPDNFVFIFAHAGISSYKEVAELMKIYPATYAELSSQSTESIEYLIDQLGSKRLLFGSDWPALPQALTLSRVLHATENNPDDRENILYKNASSLFNIELGGKYELF